MRVAQRQWKSLLVRMLTFANNVRKIRSIYDDVIIYWWFVKYVFVLCFNSLITDQMISWEERLHLNIKRDFDVCLRTQAELFLLFIGQTEDFSPWKQPSDIFPITCDGWFKSRQLADIINRQQF